MVGPLNYIIVLLSYIDIFIWSSISSTNFIIPQVFAHHPSQTYAFWSTISTTFNFHASSPLLPLLCVYFVWPRNETKEMEIPIWQWCLIVLAIIFLAIASHFLGRILCSPRERIVDSKIKNKDGPAAQEKTAKGGSDQIVWWS